MAMENIIHPWALRFSNYGRERADVVQVVKETAKTASYLTRDYNGKWFERPTLERSPSFLGRFASLADAESAASRANAVWASFDGAVSAARDELQQAQADQLAAFRKAAAEPMS